MMGLSEKQQLMMLVYAFFIGVAIGAVFDVFNVFAGVCRRRWAVYIADTLFGAVAALLTFFSALATLDGRMHPFLFIGAGVGWGIQHLILGRHICRFFVCFIRKMACGMKNISKNKKNCEKKRKIFAFFQKNS